MELFNLQNTQLGFFTQKFELLICQLNKSDFCGKNPSCLIDKFNNSDFWVINLSCVFQRLNNSDYCGKNPSFLNERLTIRIFALEIRVVYFRDCTTWIFAIKLSWVIEKLTTRIFGEKNPLFIWKNSHFVTNIKMTISIEKRNIVDVLYGPRYDIAFRWSKVYLLGV